MTESLWGDSVILADTETRVDLLNNEAIAKTIASLIGEDPERAVTVGVHGDWGAGKSSILEMIEALFEGQDDVLCIKFNAWRFQGLEDAKIALIEGVVTQLIEKRSLMTKAGDAVMEVVRRIDWLKLARKGGGLAFTAFTGLPSADQISTVVGTVKGFFADPAAFADKERIDAVVGATEGLLKESETKRVPEEVEEFRKAFDALLHRAGLKQLIVLIDDLDRCLPEPAIETLEAIRLFVMMDRTAFVIAADEAMIEYSVRKHFPDLPDSTGPRDYARNYLEKLIQVPFRIPALGEAETRIYVTLLLVGARLGDDDEHFGKLLAVARETLKRPWQSEGFDGPSVRAALGPRAGDVNDDLFLCEQIVPVLASGTQGNPRQIKRFLNGLLLRHRTAIERGFGDDVQLAVLAKLMLAERFIPTLFDQIALSAASAPDGKCKELGAVEGPAEADVAVPAPSAEGDEGVEAEVDAPADAGPIVEQWKGSEIILGWARLQPSLAGVDLRPYLFVTKDRKDYLGAGSALGHLVGVVEKLLGGRLTVTGMDASLRKLAAPEASAVFEQLRKRILGAADFNRAPAGVDGAVVLVRTQPHLQSALVDLIEMLPNGSGPWAVTGWREALTDGAALARFDAVLDKWSRQTTNKGLKAAASAARRTGKAN